MSTKKLKKPKQKAVSLQEFTASLEPTLPSAGQNIIYTPKKPMISSWADEVEEYELITEKERIVLPSAPRAARGPAYEDSQIPRVPPYKAHLGNISYEIDDEEVYNFFNGLEIDELRLPRDSNNRLRGFGYVEFRNREDLIEALIMNEKILRGRPIRISLGTGHGDAGIRKGPVDETPADWRAAGNPGMDNKIPDFGRSQSFYPPRSNFSSGGGGGLGRREYGNKPDFYNRRSDYNSGSSGRSFDNHGSYNKIGFERQHSSGSGSAYSNDFYDGRGDVGPPPPRIRIATRADFEHQNRPPRDYGNNNGCFNGSNDRDRGDYRSQSRSNEDLVRAPYQPRIVHSEPHPSCAPHELKGHGGIKEDVHNNIEEGPRMKSPTSPQSPPRERKKLVLKPRSKPPSESELPASNSSIFGGAKPVDTAAREREIEKKLSEMSLMETKKLRILQRPKPEVHPPLDFVHRKTDTSQRFRRDSSSRSGPPQPLMAEPSSPPRLFTQPISLPRRRRSDEIDRDKDTNSEPEDDRDRDRDLRFIEFHRVDHRKGRQEGGGAGTGDWRGGPHRGGGGSTTVRGRSGDGPRVN